MSKSKKNQDPRTLNKAVIGFAGDSGEGIQVIGQRFTKASAVAGNTIQSFPDFPAEIRAPSGTVAGVSGFQLQFSSLDIHTPGDKLDALVAFNPAALMASLAKVKKQGLVIVDIDKFTLKDFKKAGLEMDPLESPQMCDYRLIKAPITTLVFEAIKDSELSRASQRKCKNFFALGISCWAYQRSLQSIIDWLGLKFSQNNALIDANTCALKAGFHYAETIEMLTEPYIVEAANLEAGTWRQINGNEALCLGALAAQQKFDRDLFVAGYPITPASDILHWFAQTGVTTFQAEDEMAAAGAALGAAFAGSLALTSTSGPGMDLKAETIGLAVMVELPMVIIDVQRAGPSTGMPTKVEQADLLMAMYGRHGECPLPILAPKDPKDGYQTALEAFSLAVKYMTPVIILSDAYLANSAQPWRIPSEPMEREVIETPTLPKEGRFEPYARSPKTLARPWVCPSQAGFEHRIGGIEKQESTGDISYSPENHQKMTDIRSQKIQAIANDYDAVELVGNASGELLVIGWGSTYGALLTAVQSLHEQGASISFIHLRHLNPLPLDLLSYMKSFKKIMTFELNQGQLASILRAKYLLDIRCHSKVMGQPFQVEEIELALSKYLSEPIV